MKLLQNRGWTSWIIFVKITYNGLRKKRKRFSFKIKQDIQHRTLSSPDSYTIFPHLHSDIIAIKKPPRSESRGTR